MTAPKGASDLVQEAYTKGIAQMRYGLTEKDRRQLRAGVKRGDLWVWRGMWGCKHWLPAGYVGVLP